ncbi:MAG: 50S ribosomal protein L3 [Deltaproteobacteria bacterium]|nr:50S ribosomal protein L3 [Deltaproteobacteria bacterium]
MKVRGILGRKIGMTQIFDDRGEVVPVTVVEAGPCTVMQVKSEAGRDGYAAVKLGFDAIEERKSSKPELGRLQKAGLKPMRFVREVRIPEAELAEYSVGQQITADLFESGDFVNVTGNSKGRGFTGVVKRHGFKGSKRTHGVHEYRRHGGGPSCNTYPGRIIPGKRMCGQHGNTAFTIENLAVVGVDKEKNLLLIRGAVPGHRNTFLFIRNAKKKWKRA